MQFQHICRFCNITMSGRTFGWKTSTTGLRSASSMSASVLLHFLYFETESIVRWWTKLHRVASCSGSGRKWRNSCNGWVRVCLFVWRIPLFHRLQEGLTGRYQLWRLDKGWKVISVQISKQLFCHTSEFVQQPWCNTPKNSIMSIFETRHMTTSDLQHERTCLLVWIPSHKKCTYSMTTSPIGANLRLLAVAAALPIRTNLKSVSCRKPVCEFRPIRLDVERLTETNRLSTPRILRFDK